MQLKRISCLFSPTRLRMCFRLFRKPLRAFCSTACLGSGPFTLTLKSGESLSFSRKARDHKLWDWLLTEREPFSISFTSCHHVRLSWNSQFLLLRPGTQDPDIFQEIFVEDIYGLARLDAPLTTVIDLGANAGFFTCAVLGRAERTIAVEAVSENHRQALRNILGNNGTVVNVYRLAMAAESGKHVNIQLDNRNSGGHTVVDECPHSVGRVETVKTISLSDLMQSTNCDSVDLLKCDIEGSEFDVFLNTPIRDLRRIRRLVMEVHLSECHTIYLLSQLINHFESAGFQVTLHQDIPSAAISEHFMLTAVAADGRGLKAASVRPDLVAGPQSGDSDRTLARVSASG